MGKLKDKATDSTMAVDGRLACMAFEADEELNVIRRNVRDVATVLPASLERDWFAQVTERLDWCERELGRPTETAADVPGYLATRVESLEQIVEDQQSVRANDPAITTSVAVPVSTLKQLLNLARGIEDTTAYDPEEDAVETSSDMGYANALAYWMRAQITQLLAEEEATLRCRRTEREAR